MEFKIRPNMLTGACRNSIRYRPLTLPKTGRREPRVVERQYPDLCVIGATIPVVSDNAVFRPQSFPEISRTDYHVDADSQFRNVPLAGLLILLFGTCTSF